MGPTPHLIFYCGLGLRGPMYFPTVADALRAVCSGPIPPGPALDVGCGRGGSTLALSEVLSRYVVGLDVERERLLEARERAGPTLDFVKGDAARLPLEDRSFALASAVLTVHELEGGLVVKVLAEVRRVLKPGGVLIVIDKCRLPGLRPSEELSLLAEEAYHGARRLVTGVKSLGILSPRELLEIVESSGFTLEERVIGRLGRRLDSGDFLSSWGRETREYLRRARGHPDAERVKEIVERIVELAERYGYGPAPVLAARFSRG